MGIGKNEGGIAAVRFFADLGWNVIATDIQTAEQLNLDLAEYSHYSNITWKLGAHDENDFITVDLIVKNPAVPVTNALIALAENHGETVTNDAEIFLRVVPKKKIIGITGTKGKTTTCLLLGHLLRKKFTVEVLGIPGKSVLEIFYTPMPDYVIAEFSSFDCELISTSPHITILTSFFPDHINRHKTLNEYRRAKFNLFEYQDGGDIAFLPKSSAQEFMNDAAQIYFDIEKNTKANMPWHIHENSITAAVCGAQHLGITSAEITAQLQTFIPPTGRRQIIELGKGISIINDTTSTTPRAAADTITKILEQNFSRNIHIIVGGEDKAFPESEVELLRNVLHKIRHQVLLLPGSLSDRILIGTRVNSFKEAAQYTKERQVKMVALVPGAASFNMFVNEFDRGEKFISNMINYL